MEKSQAYRTTEGVKQGEVLSPYLFKFFINEMTTNCLDLKIAPKISANNISIVSYCDDVVILSSTSSNKVCSN